ncbi:MAG: GTPase HflX [Bdellovibrionales bacterium]
MTQAYTDISGVRHNERALVLNPVLKSERAEDDNDAALQEIVDLARAIDLAVVCGATLFLTKTVPATLLGSGQVEEFANLVKHQNIVIVVVNHTLTPVQQRNLERAFNCKVIDRVGIILEIFGARAKTSEGKLQVELAALNYQKSRLVRSWTHLERQRGGFGFMGGPGETQLETDRRIITDRIARLKKELEKVRRTRGLSREARHRAEHPTVALVGYTNAGKSTLFNRLTGAEVLVKDMLFATLDPTMRGMKLPNGREVIVSDTVGFISDLPTHLIEAFRATLEEVLQADVILHVRDISHPDAKGQRDAVMDVLADLGIAVDDERIIEVLNKIDLLPSAQEIPYVASSGGFGHGARGGKVGISALTGEGVPDLLDLIEKRVSSRAKTYDIKLPLSDGAALSWLHAHGKIVKRRDSKTHATLKVDLEKADYGRFQSKFKKKS